MLLLHVPRFRTMASLKMYTY